LLKFKGCTFSFVKQITNSGPEENPLSVQQNRFEPTLNPHGAENFLTETKSSSLW